MCKLTEKQKLFVKHYIISLNGVHSARKAGYKGSYATLGVQAHENLKNPKIRKAIDAELSKSIMPLDEALNRLSQQARGLHTQAIQGGKISLDELEEMGLMHLVKSIEPTRHGDKIIFYDAQSALAHIVKSYQQIGIEIDPDQITIIQQNVPDKPND